MPVTCGGVRLPARRELRRARFSAAKPPASAVPAPRSRPRARRPGAPGRRTRRWSAAPPPAVAVPTDWRRSSSTPDVGNPSRVRYVPTVSGSSPWFTSSTRTSGDRVRPCDERRQLAPAGRAPGRPHVHDRRRARRREVDGPPVEGVRTTAGATVPESTAAGDRRPAGTHQASSAAAPTMGAARRSAGERAHLDGGERRRRRDAPPGGEAPLPEVERGERRGREVARVGRHETEAGADERDGRGPPPPRSDRRAGAAREPFRPTRSTRNPSPA